MTTLFFNDWTYAFGWTLLHSLWQSLLIVLLVKLCLRLVPAMRSEVRYTIACAGFFAVALISVATLVYQVTGMPDHSAAQHFELAHPAGAMDEIVSPASQNRVSMPEAMGAVVVNAIEKNLPFFLLLWAVGFAYFSLRFTAGLLYTWKIRSSAVPIKNEWTAFLSRSAARLGINRMVSLAESASISSPIVIGYFKPVILIPMGLATGLTTEQLETVFLHELAHIRRHDYVVNLLQSIIESIFFFNPFIWMISALIRREREYCCDDLVVRHHGGNRAYAFALAKLAEAKLASTGLALSIAGEKNQLLNRIKRIMEKSGRNYTARNKFVIPVILLFGALLCISWLGSDGDNTSVAVVAGIDQDTIPDKKQKNSATWSRKRIVTIDENGKPHEEIVEEFEGDESLRPLLEQGAPGPGGSLLPPLSNAIDPMLPNPGVPSVPDTIPPGFSFHNNREWEDLARSFEENFRKRFEIMEEFHLHDSAFMEAFGGTFAWPDWDSLGFPKQALEALKEFQNDQAFEDLDVLRNFDPQQFKEFADPFDRNGVGIQRYEDVLRRQLIEDGYLSSKEDIESLEWSDDSFKVNGKSIKESDKEKYQKLNDKFFRHGDVGSVN